MKAYSNAALRGYFFRLRESRLKAEVFLNSDNMDQVSGVAYLASGHIKRFCNGKRPPRGMLLRNRATSS